MPDVLKRVPENLPFLDHSTYCCYKIWIWCILMTAIKAWKGNPNFEDSRSLHSCPGLRSLVWTVEFNQHIPFIFLTDARLSLLTLDLIPHTCLSVMTIMNFAASKIFGAIQLYKLHSTNHSCSFKKKRTKDNIVDIILDPSFPWCTKEENTLNRPQLLFAVGDVLQHQPSTLHPHIILWHQRVV